MATKDAIAAVAERFPELNLVAKPLMTYLDGSASDQLWLRVPADRLVEVMTFLKDDSRCKFEQLIDVAGLDYLNFPEADDRFGVVYSLLSHTHNHRLWIKVFVNDPDPQIPSLTGLWRGANWPEREIYDLFGVTFTGHPDLRRILCAEFFEDHPLRKDYPLHGRGERENFPVLTKESA